ncbi:MAG: hypothetical protein IT357_13515 [Gemmatimonadaceae bacterium]|nr:hypothetical protein [Gemmatimonadaceae bacterium]
MTDEQMQELLRDAKDSYRVPAEPPIDAMWARIEREAFDASASMPVVYGTGRAVELPSGRSRGVRRWMAPAAGIAATLLVGIGIGRVSKVTPDATSLPPVVDATPSVSVAPPSDPLLRATSEYLAQTVALLASLPRDSVGQKLTADTKFVADARALLGTTRLLMDSPAATDPRMRDLFQDLELVLAQVAQLRTAPRAQELTFIAEAMNERDVVPRLRTVAASYTASGY